MHDTPARRVPTPPAECDVLVIGAGIAGLVTAMRIRNRRPDLHVELIDVDSCVGGKLRTASLAGVTIDIGAEAVIARRPEGLALIDELGLSDSVRYPGVTDARIACGGREVPVPQDTLMGVPTDIDAVAASGLLSDEGLARLAAVRTEPLPADPTVAEAVGGQLGDEVVDRLVEPLLAGVYAGRAESLSLAATNPALRGVLDGSTDLLTAARAARATQPRSDAPVFATVEGGIGSLPGAIVRHSDLAVTLGCPARAVRRADSGFVVDVGAAPAEAEVRARSVVVATQPQKATRLLSSVSEDASRELAEVAVSSMAVIAIAYRTSDLVRPAPSHSGILVPVSEGTAVKAATYVTNKWPHVADDDLFIVRASIGRFGEQAVLQRSDDELVSLARHDLAQLAGIDGVPVDVKVHRWGGSLPQYGVGHIARVQRIRDAVARVPGLAVAGATYDGVGIPGCINSAEAAAATVLRHLEGDG